ncbi:MAG TPA: ABC transporter permease subunit [Clostridiales bacterium]|nr:ABC transporter permease subunit [Clostridiales bacterium]
MQKVNIIIKKLKMQKYLHIMTIPTVIWLIIFCYIPMYGLQIAFKNFMFNKGILGSAWVGLKHFITFFTDPYIKNVLINTFALSVIRSILIFPIPIIFALLLNEVSNSLFKKITQTISYLPYFISWVMVAIMANSWLSTTGFINKLMMFLGIIEEPYLFLGTPNAFWWIAMFLEIWKTTGWSSIIFLAAISGIDQEMYESSFIDGANRFQRIWYITLPSILGTIMILLILTLSRVLTSANFEVSYLLSNPLNFSKSDILATYILRIGISLGRYSYATAVGLLQSVVAFVLLFAANFGSKKATDISFF